MVERDAHRQYVASAVGFCGRFCIDPVEYRLRRARMLSAIKTPIRNGATFNRMHKRGMVRRFWTNANIQKVVIF